MPEANLSMIESLFLLTIVFAIAVLAIVLVLSFLLYRTALHQIEVSLGTERALLSSVAEMSARVGTSEVILMRLETALAVTDQKLDPTTGQKIDRLEGLMQATKTDQAALTSLLVTFMQQAGQQQQAARQPRKRENPQQAMTGFTQVPTPPFGAVQSGQAHPIFQGPVIESTKPIGGGELPPRT